METTHQVMKRNTIVSAFSLFFQSGYSAVLGLVANVVLTILLTPAIFGIYITVLSLISVLNYFSDIGLAAALIQKKEIVEDDLKTTFTIQQTLIICIITIGFFASSFVAQFYKLPVEGVTLYHVLLLSFFLSSLKTIPSVLLERKIQFQKIVLVQIIENTVFYITVIISALFGLGLTSFTIAVFSRAIIGVICIYSLSFWLPKVGISKESMHKLVSFGLPFQASSFLALFKDDLITLFLGKVLGFESVGYIGWAKKWAEAPIRIIMDNISRVLFPLLSRIQQEKEKISSIMEKIFFYQTITIAPALLGLALIMSEVVHLIPRYGKWAPALPLLYIFCLSALFSSYSTPLINMFNAIGKVKLSFTFMLVWTIFVWIFTPLSVYFFHLYGFPLVQLIVSASFIVVLFQAQKISSFHFIKSIDRPLLSTAGMGLILSMCLYLFPHNYFFLILTIFIGIVSYLLFLLLFKINFIVIVRTLLK